MEKLYQSAKGPSVELMLKSIKGFTEETRVLNSIERMLSELLTNSALKKDGEHEFGKVWLTRFNVRKEASLGTFQIYYSPSIWEQNHRIFTATQFTVATGNYIERSIQFRFPDNLGIVLTPVRELFHKMGFTEK